MSNDDNNIISRIFSIKENLYEIKNIKVSETSRFSNSLTIIKIQKFKKFLNSKNPFKTELFDLYCPAIKKNIQYSIILIPSIYESSSFLSIKLEFSSEKGERINYLHQHLNDVNIINNIFSNKKDFYIFKNNKI